MIKKDNSFDRAIIILLLLLFMFCSITFYGTGYRTGRETYLNHFEKMQTLYSECVLQNTEFFAAQSEAYMNLKKDYLECKIEVAKK